MANLYNLKRFDLNLLVIFECIYQNLSISKAAETLFITPSAVSQSLQRLRVQLNDPLFVRSGKGITPTTVAINLHHHLEQNLNSIEETINITGKTELKRRFVVYGPQFHAIPELTQFINILFEDPNMEVVYNDTASETDQIEDLLNYRKADVVFTLEKCESRSLACTPFSECEVLLICRKDHPRLGDTASTDEILQERFAVLQSREHQVKEYLKMYSSARLAERDIAFSSSSLMSVFNAIHHSDLVGIAPKYIFESLKDTLQLKQITTPTTMPKFNLYMVYSRSSLSSPFFQEIINRIHEDKIIHTKNT
ncbi:DNA-binding transcriptional repressor CitR [Kluyvera chengduensis]|uniref:DNA-binding transcriptional repressor CitR n=1 Tax=Kluyvera sp. 142359 TaxID=3375726 RepID=UPI003773EE58